MFDRLKSLPLTIVLTILIWMYAESQVNSAHDEDGYTVSNVPVWVSGPPPTLARYDVMVQSQTVSVFVSGAHDRVEALRAQSADQEKGIYAYLDINPDDRPSDSVSHRLLRIVTPTGLSVLQPPEVTFKLMEKPATSQTSPVTP